MVSVEEIIFILLCSYESVLKDRSELLMILGHKQVLVSVVKALYLVYYEHQISLENDIIINENVLRSRVSLYNHVTGISHVQEKIDNYFIGPIILVRDYLNNRKVI